MVNILFNVSYSFTLKCMFSYILFKYAQQLKAKEEQRDERKQTVKEVQMEMQQIGQPVDVEEQLPQQMQPGTQNQQQNQEVDIFGSDQKALNKMNEM